MAKKSDATLMENKLRQLMADKFKSTEDKLKFALGYISNGNAFMIELAQKAVVSYGEINDAILSGKHSPTIHDLVMRYCWEDIEEKFNEVIKELPIDFICEEI